jgi:exonuclease SbcD
VSVVDLDASGNVSAETVSLTPLRDLRVIEGSLENLLAAGEKDPARTDYLLARLTDTHAILDVMAKLRAVYPNVLHVERPALQRVGDRRVASDHLHTGELPMFADFWQQVTGDELDDESRAIVADAIDGLNLGEDR